MSFEKPKDFNQEQQEGLAFLGMKIEQRIAEIEEIQRAIKAAKEEIATSYEMLEQGKETLSDEAKLQRRQQARKTANNSHDRYVAYEKRITEVEMRFERQQKELIDSTQSLQHKLDDMALKLSQAIDELSEYKRGYTDLQHIDISEDTDNIN